MKLFNKKAQVDDLFDLIFTVVISFFLLFFVNAALLNTVEQSQSASLRDAADANKILSAINNLRVQANMGSTLNPEKINQKIEQSRVLGGKVITTCFDYYTQEDCNNDVIGITADSADYCQWNEEQKVCQYIPEVLIS